MHLIEKSELNVDVSMGILINNLNHPKTCEYIFML